MQASKQSKEVKAEVVVKVSHHDGYEVIIIERKQEPARYNGIEI